MAGGNYTNQNKVRAGAYINFKAVSKSSSELGVRGVVALAMPLPWGEQVTEVFSTDLADGRSVAKVGLSINDEESLALRLALQNAYKAVIYRADSNGTKAAATFGEEATALSVSAKYDGIFGNRLSVAIKVQADKFVVLTYLDGREVDTQVIADYKELTENAYVSFSGTGEPIASAGTALRGGENGIVELKTMVTDYLKEIVKHSWNVLAFPYDNDDLKLQLEITINDLRDNRGKYRQAVVLNGGKFDCVGLVSVSQGYVAGNDYVSPESFVYYVAGLQAGSEITDSNTYREIRGATKIINEYDDQEVIEKLQKGEFLITRRNDGVVVVEKDINTLHNFTLDAPYAYSKNKVIRVMDGIATWVSDRFAAFYIGKVTNNEDGRAIFKADVIAYLETLQTIGAVQNFDAGVDVEVVAGDQIDGLECNINVQPSDSMEKLYMTVTVRS